MKTFWRLGGWISCWFIFAGGWTAASPLMLIPPNAEWKYLANGIDQGTAWRGLSFNDLAWSSGQAQLGYGDGDETTIVATPSPRPPTVYFRKTFTWPAGSVPEPLRLQLMRDDGAVVYVNGLEVFRNNMPAGGISFSTLATVALGGSDESVFLETTIPASSIVAGTNIVAVEVHQVSVDSSDMSFALTLIAGTNAPPEPAVTVVASNPVTRELSPNVDAPVQPGVFRIHRTGPTDQPLNVYFTLTGSAQYGVDYVSFPLLGADPPWGRDPAAQGEVQIPAGEQSADVIILAEDDTLVEGTETVVLTLVPVLCFAPPCPVIGSPNQAAISILDNDTPPSNAPPVVTIHAPHEGEVFTAPADILLLAAASDPEDGDNISVEFFEGTNRIGAATFIPSLCPATSCPSFYLTWSNVPPGHHTVRAVAKDSAGNTAVSAPVSFSVISQPPAEPKVLVAANAAWRYLDNGSDQGSAWRAPNFDDSHWATGPAQLGFGEGDEQTILNFGSNGLSHITYYFRHAFNVAGAGGISNLVVRLLRDDGGVVYLNGVEVFRSNMPTGAIHYQTLAAAVAGGGDETNFFSANIDPLLLREGQNVLAVEIHQVGVTSGDLSFALQLLGTGGFVPPEHTRISVVATDPQASESGAAAFINPGQFAVRRTGNLNHNIPVHFRLSGTASNSVDYVFITNGITIPAGATQALINIAPLEDGQTEGTETVVLTLLPVVCPAIAPVPPECYEIVGTNRATVFIADAPSNTNRPPIVQINAPENGAVFTAAANIELRAFAQDPENGHEVQVEFFAGTNSIGFGTFVPTLCPAPFCPYFTLTWSNAPVGHHTLTAQATDANGATTISAPIHITIAMPGTNFPIVRVFASDNSASEQGSSTNTGRFTFVRTGPVSNSLPVYYALSGTAANGDDYVVTNTVIVIPAGSTNANLTLRAIDDSETEPTETVIVTVVRPPPIAFTPPYDIGSPSNATVFIHDNDSNAPPATNVTLIAKGSFWKYLDDGTDQGMAWRAPAFNDATWSQGPAQLGYGDGDEATVLNPDANGDGLKSITYYFRRTFHIENAASVSGLLVKLLRDDGAVVYLNGVEVFRSNMPDGPITYQTLAIENVQAPFETTQFVAAAISPGALVEGLNVMAVEIHQVAVTSQDISFDFELLAERGASTERTVVQVFPADSQAVEPGGGVIGLGQYAIHRAGNLGSSIPVFFRMSGSASNGVDYSFISNQVVIPAGSTQVLVTLTPLSDNLLEGTEIAELTILPPVCPAVFPPPPECYEVGNSNSAVVFIADAPGGTNQSPVAFWLAPANGSVFTQGMNILLRASAVDLDGTISRVDFLRSSTVIGSVTTPTEGTNYSFLWSNAPAGTHTLRAVAFDNLNARGTSAPVTITVLGPPGTNLPVVRVFASDNSAAEGLFSDPGRFTFTRTGPLTNSLPVYFVLSGTASNGLDYVLTNSSVVIPAGSTNANLIVHAIDDSETEPTESVTLTVVRPPGVFSPPYTVGSPSNATAFIHDNDSNAPPGTNVTLVAKGSIWRYLDDGSNQGSAWQAVSFDDASWAAGPAQLGFGDGDEATIINGGPTNPIVTAYFRRSFNVSNPLSLSNLTVSLLRDDGGVVYLNGVEVFRSNMPTGLINYLTLAVTAAGGGDETSNFYSAPLTSSLLVSGENVVAVEIHQNAFTSSDMSFDLELVAEGAQQPPEERTVVHVVATDPQAVEQSITPAVNPGQFAIRRTGNLDFAIPVLIRLSGTASNGVDYHFVSNRVVIPAGATQALVNIVPLVDNAAEGIETVVLTLEPIGCVAIVPTPPECYIVGAPNQATVTISDGSFGTNRPPVATWIAPANGSVFTQGLQIVLRASASDPDGTISRVEFRSDTLIGTDTTPGGTNSSEYLLVWSNAPAGSHTVFAVAIDNANARGTSAPVNITVAARPANALPMVTITSPTNGSVFVAPGTILIEAVTRDPDGYADTVEFFANNQKIGETEIVFIQAPEPGTPIFFDFTWTNPPVGLHVLRARTIDNLGARGTSAPVNITVRSESPDADGDGVPNERDQCANTPPGTVVNEHGCSIAQLCPCDGQWRNHNEYVQCVRDTSRAFVEAGLISEAARKEIVEAARKSDCGRRRPRLNVPVQCVDEIRTNGCRLLLEGDGPATCFVEWSDDLIRWNPMCTRTLSGETIEIVDPGACTAPRRFYRVRIEESLELAPIPK